MPAFIMPPLSEAELRTVDEEMLHLEEGSHVAQRLRRDFELEGGNFFEEECKAVIDRLIEQWCGDDAHVYI